jgi:hypothetical protein
MALVVVAIAVLSQVMKIVVVVVPVVVLAALGAALLHGRGSPVTAPAGLELAPGAQRIGAAAFAPGAVGRVVALPLASFLDAALSKARGALPNGGMHGKDRPVRRVVLLQQHVVAALAHVGWDVAGLGGVQERVEQEAVGDLQRALPDVLMGAADGWARLEAEHAAPAVGREPGELHDETFSCSPSSPPVRRVRAWRGAWAVPISGRGIDRTQLRSGTMMALIVALGALIGVASGILGAGPSILTVLLLTDVAGLAMPRAVVTSLAVVALMSLVALVPYARQGAIDWRAAFAFGLASTTGAFVAGHLAREVPERALQGIFVLATLVAATAMLRGRRTGEQPPAPAPWRSLAVLAISGLLVGTLTGLIGLGGGFAVVPLLVVFAGTSVHAAIGTSILVIAINTLAGLAGHLPHPPVAWRLAAFLGTAECAGSLTGARLAHRVSNVARRRAFALIMIAAAAVSIHRALQG